MLISAEKTDVLSVVSIRTVLKMTFSVADFLFTSVEKLLNCSAVLKGQTVRNSVENLEILKEDSGAGCFFGIF